MSVEHPEITVVQQPEQARYALLDGGERIGLAAYVEHDGRRVFYHTVVDEAYGGQGLASRLVKEALADSFAAGVSVVPVCPYVRSWLRKHPEEAARTVSATEADLALLRALG